MVCKGEQQTGVYTVGVDFGNIVQYVFVYGFGYFSARSLLEVIVFVIGFIVLRRDTLRSSALMGAISIVLALLFNIDVPFHLG